MPYCGIWMNNVGTETAGTTRAGGRFVPSAYYEAVIGDDGVTANNDYLNVFDHMYVGVYGKSSNFTCLNNLFMDMIADTRPYVVITGLGTSATPYYYPTGDGVYAGSEIDGSLQKRLQVHNSPGSTLGNSFYGFDNGIESDNYYCLDVQHTYMINKRPTVPLWYLSPGYRSGSYGIKLTSAHYDQFNVNYNIIDNINTGIMLWQVNSPRMGPGFAYQQYLGQCNIQYNSVRAHPYGYSAIGTGPEQMLTGISVKNMISRTGPFLVLSTSTGQLNVDHNTVNDAYSGISVEYSFAQVATTSYNNIYIRPPLTTSTALQYGINHIICHGSNIYDNFVYPSVSAETTARASMNMRGYNSTNNSQIMIGCNTVSDMGRGFEFYMGNPKASWMANDMYQNSMGMVLNGAVIGQQGNSSVQSQNNWIPVSWWSGSNYHTYQFSSATISSKLWLYGGPNHIPTNNNGYPPKYTYQSSGVNQSLYTVTVTPAPPIVCPIVPVDMGGGVFESMARQTLPYTINIIPNNWNGQYQTWRTTQLDSSLADSSVILAKFDTMASTSRYALLTDIESYLAMGDLTSASALLASGLDTVAHPDTDAITGVRLADSHAADYIVQNYMSYYRLYIKFVNTTMSAEDSTNVMTLAQLCPIQNGAVVYQARALYSYLYNDVNAVYNDDSCVTVDTTYVAERHANPTPALPKGEGGIAQKNGNQIYQLYPNPSHGLINLQQAVADGEPVHAEIWNALGQSMYKADLSFANRTDQIRMASVVPGLYLLKLTDSKGREFIFRFVEE